MFLDRVPCRVLPPILVAGVLALAAARPAAQLERTLDDYTEWLAWADGEIERIVAVPAAERTYENTLGALDDVYARLTIELTFPQVLALLSPHAGDREIGNAVEAALNEWNIETGKREDLYGAIAAYAERRPPLAGERLRLLEHTMRDYRRDGMALPPAERETLKAIQKELSDLSIAFNKNAQEDETVVLLAPGELAGMPADFVAQLEEVAGLLAVPIDDSTATEVWRQCSDERTRKKLWVAYKRKGGQQNVGVLEQMLAQRAAEANLLGYAHSADFQTEILMSKNAAAVAAFYDQLRPLVRKKSDRDFAALRDLKRHDTGDPQAGFHPWDYWYYAAAAQREQYAVDMERVRQYFPLQQVVDGVFTISSTLYGLQFREATAEARAEGLYFWHPDVRFWRIYDGKTGEMLGELYTDLHPRPFKRGGAFFWDFVPRKVWMDGSVTTLRAVLQCNFTRPTPEKPSLLTHPEVTTLFHEFGHFLHGVLSRAETVGCGNCERDFVELPSQIFENWCWEPDVLRLYARHYQTGEALPDELLRGMIAARQFASGMLAERQYCYGLVDQAYNRLREGETIDVTQVGLDLQAEVEQYEAVPGTWFQSGFTHLTNYVASYYGYQWSLVYACACFEKYKELGMMNPAAGQRFAAAILSRAGTADGMDMLRDFLGGEPTMGAYLEYLGLED
ncbi:MAG: M3 family metallopeptidase [Planctomycetota bacterium]